MERVCGAAIIAAVTGLTHEKARQRELAGFEFLCNES